MNGIVLQSLLRKRYILGLAVLTSIFFVSATAFGGTIFDLSAVNGLGYMPPQYGSGQGVVVDTTTLITRMGIYSRMPLGDNVKFMIWDDTNSNLLYVSQRYIAPMAGPDWIYSDPFSFTAEAGHTYWFGVIPDDTVAYGFIVPSVDYSSNGLTATSQSAAYSNFDHPYFSHAGAQIGLRLEGEQVASPEPATIVMLGTGVMGMAGTIRRKLL